jgi:diguanylate cyclase (GGDEF)-like protein
VFALAALCRLCKKGDSFVAPDGIVGQIAHAGARPLRDRSAMPSLYLCDAPAWRLYLARPQEAFACAQASITTHLEGDSNAVATTASGLASAYLLRALAQCRMMGQTVDDKRISEDFATAAQIFRERNDKRGLRLTELAPAAIAMRLGHWPAALREFEALIGHFDLSTLDADNFYLCFGLSTCYVYAGRLEEGLRFGYAALHLAEQLDLLPEFAAAAMPLGVALMAAKDPEEAATLLREAITVAVRAESPVLSKALRNNCAVALRRIGHFDEARVLLDQVLADTSPMVGGQHFVHYNAAELHLMLGELDRAETHYAIAQGLLSAQGASGLDLIKLHYIEGAIASRRGELDQAIHAFRRVAHMLPEVSALRFNDRAEFYDELADVLARAGRPVEAFAAQRQSSRQYQQSLAVVNRMRRFSMQVRQEIQQVARDLERVSLERHQLQAINRQLREQVDVTLSEATRLRNEVSHDSLTGVFSRRYLDAALPSLLQLSRQSATPFSIVMIDLDHFKNINDRHGHAVGDEVLVRFGALARNSLRGSDIVGRYGGEEFYLALVGCGSSAAQQRIETLLARFRSLTLDTDEAAVRGLTFSAGIAVYPEDGTDVRKLIACADRRLLQAKAEGRARIVCREAMVTH